MLRRKCDLAKQRAFYVLQSRVKNEQVEDTESL